MQVKNILDQKETKGVITVQSSTGFDEAIALLVKHQISCLPIVDDGELKGIISDRDILKKIDSTGCDVKNMTVADAMSTKLIVGVPEDEIEYLAGVMDKNWIRHIPIVQGDKLIGLVSQRDIVHFLHHHAQIENRYLSYYMESLQHRDKSGDH